MMKTVHKFFAAGTDKRIDIFYMVEGLLLAGIDLARVLNTVSQAAEARDDSSTVAMVNHWQDALANSRFPEEMTYWVPASEAVVFQGYGLGRISAAELFNGAARIAELKGKLIAEVMKASVMPVVLALACVVMLWMAGGHMLPSLESISDRSSWSPTTVIVSDTAKWVNANTILVAAMIGTVVAVFWIVTIGYSGPGRRTLDRLPPFSLYKLVTGCSFLIVTLEFVRVGQDLSSRFFLRLEDTSTPYVRSRIRSVRENMARGTQFGAALKASGNNFPDAGLIAVAEALDGTENWNIELGKFMERWVERSERTLKTRLGLLRNLLIVLVAFVLGSLISAMFDVMSQAQ